MPTTKPFAIATEGPTIDGRNITRQQIEEMAKSYDPAVYTALVNLEHYISFFPDSGFSAYGKVISLSTRETEILGEKRLQLMAVADVSDAAAELQHKGKKAFASMEVMPNFVGHGVSYLTGLALTDTPASLGTETMRFSAFPGAKDNRYAFAGETSIEIEHADTDNKPETSLGDRLFARVKELLGVTGKTTDARFSDHAQAVTSIAESQREVLSASARIEASITAHETRIKELETALAAKAEEFKSFKASLEKQPDAPARPPATGASSAAKTDC